MLLCFLRQGVSFLIDSIPRSTTEFFDLIRRSKIPARLIGNMELISDPICFRVTFTINRRLKQKKDSPIEGSLNVKEEPDWS